MDIENNLAQLYQYAATYQFAAFGELFGSMEGSLPAQSLCEAYLMRAQLKLFISDPTLLNDLDKAEAAAQPRFPFLGNVWKPDAPNRFIVFPKEPDMLHAFKQSLPEAGERLAKLFGRQALITVQQLYAEICYFQCEIEEALEYTQGQPWQEYNNKTDAILLLFLQYRCHLALGSQKAAESCMLDIIYLSKSYPECVAPYQAFRDWAILTTNWNGDSPRFYTDAGGTKVPILEDRLASIREGSSQARPLELPFIACAERTYNAAYPIRKLYMDVFHAIYWQSVGDKKQADYYLLNVYETEQASGIITPAVECGEQILPLMQHAKSSLPDIPSSWIDKTVSLAQRFEAGIANYVV